MNDSPVVRVALRTAAFLAAFLPALLQAGPVTPPEATATPATPAMTPADLGAFFDTLIPLQLERNGIAGAVVAVVKDGRTVFAKGYGYADVAKRTPVSPGDTLFRIGSVSKLLMWTAVMQQVEQGRIDLDADVNRYLDFKIPDAFGQPVTMRHLMTHTAGFEDTLQGLFVSDTAHLARLGAHLAAQIPARIRPPGTVGAYSNYGAALAGYIVQRVSGEDFADYVQRHIAGPLGMARTTFAQPLPPALAPLMSSGYLSPADGALPFELVQDYPAGSVSASALDMCAFMIAHLQDGEFQGARILQPATARQMHAAQRAFEPGDHAMCLGFYEDSRNGHRVIAHAGDTFLFHSDLHLILDAGVGIFVSYNSAGNKTVETRRYLYGKFLDRYFPAPHAPPQPIASAAADARRIAGSYLTSRRGQTNMLFLPALLSEFKVAPNADGTLTVSGLKGFDQEPLTWVETAPGVWQEKNGAPHRIVFKQDAGGQWQLSVGVPVVVFQRVQWYRDGALVVLELVLAAGICLATLVLWPVAAFVRKHYRQAPAEAGELRARRWVRLSAGLTVVFWLAYAVVLGLVSEQPASSATPQGDRLLTIVVLLAWVHAVGAVPAVVAGVRAWNVPSLWWWTKLHRTLVALACLGSVAIAVYGNILALHVRF